MAKMPGDVSGLLYYFPNSIFLTISHLVHSDFRNSALSEKNGYSDNHILNKRRHRAHWEPRTTSIFCDNATVTADKEIITGQSLSFRHFFISITSLFLKCKEALISPDLRRYSGLNIKRDPVPIEFTVSSLFMASYNLRFSFHSLIPSEVTFFKEGILEIGGKLVFSKLAWRH